MFSRTATPFNTKNYTARTIGFACAGLVLGCVSAFVRPHATINGFHVEAAIEFFLLLPLMCLLALYLQLRTPLKHAVPALIGQLTVLYCADLIGHQIGAIGQQFLNDFFGVILAFWTGSVALLTLILFAVHKIWPLRHASSDCPSCGYSLVGIGSQGNCPECGRPFTAQSLGVSAEEMGV